VLLQSELAQNAALFEPPLLLLSAAEPFAVFCEPVVFEMRADGQIAVF